MICDVRVVRVNSFLMVHGKCRLRGQLFSENVVNVKVTLNYKHRCPSL